MSEFIFQITPTFLYKQFSNMYHITLNYVHYTDPGLIQAIRNGFLLTVFIITTFTFFPGAPMYFHDSNSSKSHHHHDDDDDDGDGQGKQDEHVSNENSSETGQEEDDIIMSLRAKLRSIVWVGFLLGSIWILQQTYHIPLGRLLHDAFPQEMAILVRIWNTVMERN